MPMLLQVPQPRLAAQTAAEAMSALPDLLPAIEIESALRPYPVKPPSPNDAHLGPGRGHAVARDKRPRGVPQRVGATGGRSAYVASASVKLAWQRSFPEGGRSTTDSLPSSHRSESAPRANRRQAAARPAWNPSKYVNVTDTSTADRRRRALSANGGEGTGAVDVSATGSAEGIMPVSLRSSDSSLHLPLPHPSAVNKSREGLPNTSVGNVPFSSTGQRVKHPIQYPPSNPFSFPRHQQLDPQGQPIKEVEWESARPSTFFEADWHGSDLPSGHHWPGPAASTLRSVKALASNMDAKTQISPPLRIGAATSALRSTSGSRSRSAVGRAHPTHVQMQKQIQRKQWAVPSVTPSSRSLPPPLGDGNKGRATTRPRAAVYAAADGVALVPRKAFLMADRSRVALGKSDMAR